MLTHEERKRFGEAVRAARVAKGWTPMQLIGALMLAEPSLVPSAATLVRLENGGLTPSEEAKGLKTKDTERNVQLRQAVAKILGLAVPTGSPAPAAKAPAPDKAKFKRKVGMVVNGSLDTRVTATLVREAPAVALQPKNGMSAARAAREANRAAGKPQGRADIPKMVKFYTSLTTDHGFSLGAIRATLRQLTALGIPTDAVRGEIKQKFAHYIDTLDV